ncbi:MAG: fibronectin type III domain-containing protein [Chloroflexi bacterium]|nr:fibronectin type III domain-containing protein [Chloroflexota bacterium]
MTITLSWAASNGATSYEYCFALTAASCTNWKSVGAARTVNVPNLAKNKAYFWNVRARNSAGFTVSNGGVWKFTTRR